MPVGTLSTQSAGTAKVQVCGTNPSDAEVLLAAAKHLLHPSDRLIDCTGSDPDRVAYAVLTIALYRRRDLLLRALVEDWDRERILKELY